MPLLAELVALYVAVAIKISLLRSFFSNLLGRNALPLLAAASPSHLYQHLFKNGPGLRHAECECSAEIKCSVPRQQDYASNEWVSVEEMFERENDSNR